MNKTIISLAILLISFVSIAQNPQIIWDKTYGGTDYDGVSKIKKTSDGGYLVVGYTYSSDDDVHDHYGNFYSDGYVLKLDANEDTLWTRALGGVFHEFANDALETSDGNFLIALSAESNDGDVSVKVGGSSADFWLVMLDTDGNMLWDSTYGGSGTDKPYAVYETTGGNFIVSGFTSSSNIDVSTNYGYDDIWVIKVDHEGDLLWEKTFGGSDSEVAYSMKQTLDSNLIIGGYTWSTDGDISSTHNGWIDYWVLKIDTSGTLLWENTFGGTSREFGYDIEAMSDSNFVIVGASQSSDGDVSTAWGGWDNWAVKIDKNGEMIWEKSYGGSGNDYCYRIIENSIGGYLMLHTTASTDGQISNRYLNDDIWVVNTDSAGTIIWQQTFGGDGIDFAYDAVQTNTGEYLMGASTQSDNYDVTSGLHSVGKEDVWLVKLKSLPPLEQDICLITVDSTSQHNVVVWQRPNVVGIDSFRVYRNRTGNFEYAGSVSWDSTMVFVDTLSSVNPNAFSYQYVLSTVDTLGYKSDTAAFHQTILLQASVGISGEVNLSWNQYIGFDFSTYTILRDSTGTGDYEVWNATSALSAIDWNPPQSATLDYIVDVSPASPCDPARRATSYNSSRSNRKQIIASQFPVPEAGFEASALTIETGNSISFTDTSINSPTEWKWYFEGGTPATSTNQNPTVSYTTTGIFDVDFVAINFAGEDSIHFEAHITITDGGGNITATAPVADFTSTSTNINLGDSISFFDLSTNTPTQWQWVFTNGTPATSTAQNPANIKYNTVGNHNVTLIATNAAGNDSEIKTGYITVNAISSSIDNFSTTTKIYPNPASNYLIIETTDNITYILYDIIGNKIINEQLNNTTKQIDIKHLNAGTYLIEIEKEGKSLFQQKIVVE